MTQYGVEIGDLWHQVNREMHEHFRQTLRGTDLLPVAHILLRTIIREPGITISELSRRTGIVKSHVSKLVDQLVQQGLVEKRSDPADQRLLHMYQTQAATKKLAELMRSVQSTWEHILADVPVQDQADIARSMHILLRALKRAEQQGPQMHR